MFTLNLKASLEAGNRRRALRILRVGLFIYEAMLFGTGINSPRTTEVELTRYCLKSFREVEHLGALVAAV